MGFGFLGTIIWCVQWGFIFYRFGSVQLETKKKGGTGKGKTWSHVEILPGSGTKKKKKKEKKASLGGGKGETNGKLESRWVQLANRSKSQ